MLLIRCLLFYLSLLLFQKRKPRVSQEWQQKLPEFVKRLEESLYRDAASKVMCLSVVNITKLSWHSQGLVHFCSVLKHLCTFD